MIEKVTKKTALSFVKCLNQSSCTALRMRTAYACYGLDATAYSFYIADGCAALMVTGQSALFCGDKITDTDELLAFLEAMHIKSFISENMLLPKWTAAPRLLMKCVSNLGQIEQFSPKSLENGAIIDENPDLWRLSKMLAKADENVDADAWYADACTRRNKGCGRVHAVKIAAKAGGQQGEAADKEGEYVSLIYAQCMTPQGIYLTSVHTLPAYRNKGYATALLASFCRGDEVYLICETNKRRFYEKRGFKLAAPICEYINDSKG